MPTRTKNIRILPDSVVNGIAAGEVVERPASVVKELVENAIDAGAGRINIDLEDAGRGLIRVADDGTGMSRDDALLSLERHATSKVRALSDLEDLDTLGFRGEALPSIAAVGRLVMESWDGGADEGTRVTVDNGKLVDVAACGRARGTTVSLRRIFSRLPARRKFLRSRQTELAWCLSAVEDASLSRPQLHFQLSSDRSVRMQLPPVDDLRKRIASIWDGPTASGMVHVEASHGGVGVSGYISPPTLTYSRRVRYKVLVNGRPIRDPGLNRMIAAATSDLYPGGRFPAMVLSLEVPQDLVDINVHPAKREVRLRSAREVGEVIRMAAAGMRTARVAVPPRYQAPPPQSGDTAARETALPFGTGAGDRLVPQGVEAVRGQDPAPGDPRRILGQFMATYILYEEGGVLNLVDQHAAHERITYNRLMSRFGGPGAGVQTLAVPVLLEPGPAALASLKARRGVLEEIGFLLEDFGPGAVRITGVPVALAGGPVKELLERIFLDLEDAGEIPEEVVLMVSRAACRASVKAGQRLSTVEMDRLVTDLLEAEAGLACPHGRPTRVSVSVGEVERMFGRK